MAHRIHGNCALRIADKELADVVLVDIVGQGDRLRARRRVRIRPLHERPGELGDLDSGDRRRTRLRLSSAGQSVYTRVAPLALNYEKKLLDALSATDRRALDRLVGRLIERAKRLAASSTPL